MTKITIPILVSKSGAIQTGWFCCKAGGEQPQYELDKAYEYMLESDSNTGTQVVNIEAEIDIKALFENHTIRGVAQTEEE